MAWMFLLAARVLEIVWSLHDDALAGLHAGNAGVCQS